MTTPFQILTATTAREVCGSPSDAAFLKDLIANDKILRGCVAPGSTISEVAMYDGGDRARMVKTLEAAGWRITQATGLGCIHVNL
jgi:hypothetical protein